MHIFLHYKTTFIQLNKCTTAHQVSNHMLSFTDINWKCHFFENLEIIKPFTDTYMSCGMITLLMGDKSILKDKDFHIILSYADNWNKNTVILWLKYYATNWCPYNWHTWRLYLHFTTVHKMQYNTTISTSFLHYKEIYHAIFVSVLNF